MRDLNQNARAIACLRITSAGAAVGEIQQDLNALADDLVTLVAADARHKSDAAGIVLVRGVIEALRGRQTIGVETGRHGLRQRTRFPFESMVLGRASEGDSGSHTSAPTQLFI